MTASPLPAPSLTTLSARPSKSRRPLVALLGPAYVTAVAYVDPGNFATNVTAGSKYGYLLSG